MIKNDKKFVGVLLSVGIYILVTALVAISAFVSASSPKQSFTIVVDAGHGGIDRGAYGRKTNSPESQINLDISKLLEKRLKNAGFDVVMTREGDYGLYGDISKGFKRRDMAARKSIAESSDARLLVSIHCNISPSASTRGVVVYYNKEEPTSVVLAQSLETELKKIKETEGKVRLDAEKMFMTHSIDLPSVIVECGFLSNELDETLLLDPSYQKKLSDKIYNGIFKTLYSASEISAK